MLLTLFTNDPQLAARADAAGIDRIGLDLERLNKDQRQDARKTWISDHQERELSAVCSSLKHARLFVRTEPMHDGLKPQIDRVIDAGAETLMLPFFRTVDEAARFIDYVNGRAEVSLLVETATAAARLEEIVKLDGIHDVHIGLNDLHLSLGLSSHFELLTSRLMEHLCQIVREAGVTLGFGGIGRYGDDRLPISSDLVYAQYAHLQAHSALVSRVFLTPDPALINIPREVQNARKRIEVWRHKPAAERVAARDQLRELAMAGRREQKRPTEHTGA